MTKPTKRTASASTTAIPKAKNKTTATKSAAPSTSLSLADQPAVAPGAIPVGGTDTQEQALAVTHTQEQGATISATGTISREQAERLADKVEKKLYDVTLQDGSRLRVDKTSSGVGCTIHDKDGVLRVKTGGALRSDPEVETGTLGKIVDKFNGVEMTDVPIPRAAALDSLAPTGDRVRTDVPATNLSEAEAYALGTAPADADQVTTQLAEPLSKLQEDWQLRTNDKGQVVGIGLGEETTAKADLSKYEMQMQHDTSGKLIAVGMGFSIEPGPVTTRLKMTLHSVTPLVPTPTVADGVENPLTRCTFGAVYSPNPTEEDGVFGKATPYGSLSYNVRSEIAEGLEVGQAYYVDITKVPA